MIIGIKLRRKNLTNRQKKIRSIKSSLNSCKANRENAEYNMYSSLHGAVGVMKFSNITDVFYLSFTDDSLNLKFMKKKSRNTENIQNLALINNPIDSKTSNKKLQFVSTKLKLK